jgi:hypothetical protein
VRPHLNQQLGTEAVQETPKWEVEFKPQCHTHIHAHTPCNYILLSRREPCTLTWPQGKEWKGKKGKNCVLTWQDRRANFKLDLF